MKRITIVIDDQHATWLDTHGPNASAAIRAALDDYLSQSALLSRLEAKLDRLLSLAGASPSPLPCSPWEREQG